jgi:NAD(P)-dependent dehydrogenase (short-subunit alcohol dehydrogenase family)
MDGLRVKFDFSGARVLVTGGSNGIGLGIATAFAESDAEVTITGMRGSASEYDHDLSAFSFESVDVRNSAALDALAASQNRLDILVNNAGSTDPAREWQPDGFQEAVSIHLFSTFRLSMGCQGALSKSVLGGGGSVLNMASMTAFGAALWNPGYGASKAAIVELTKTLAVNWARQNIRVNCVAPGLIESNMTLHMKGDSELEKSEVEKAPMARWGTPADVAPAFLYLASPAASFVTGQTLCVDGGCQAI